MDPCYAFSSAGSGRIVYKTRTYKQSLVEKFQFFTTRASPILDMSVRQFIVGAVLALSSLSFASAVPQRRDAPQPGCPYVATTTFTQTLNIVAPTTTGVYETTTITQTETLPPIATTTVFSTRGTEIITETFLYSNWYADPPYPSYCTVSGVYGP